MNMEWNQLQNERYHYPGIAPGQEVARGDFASLPAPRGEVWILTLPALARESGPLHGPFPLASFGNQLKNQCQDQRQQASIGGTEICPMPPLDRLNRYRFRYRTGRLLLLTTYIYFELLLISWWNPIRIWPQSRQRRRHQQLQRNRSRTTLSYPWCTLLQMDFVYTWNLPLYKYLIKGYTSNLYKDFYV